MKRKKTNEYKSFNSRTPGGVRLSTTSSISVPRYVSIHAPREGCDRNRPIVGGWEKCFNSRTPGGVRPSRSAPASMRSLFQFTHPGRGATRVGASYHHWLRRFNSRTPGGVRLNLNRRHLLNSIRFNSRTPGGVRLITPVVKT